MGVSWATGSFTIISTPTCSSSSWPAMVRLRTIYALNLEGTGGFTPHIPEPNPLNFSMEAEGPYRTPDQQFVVVPGSVARPTARQSSWAVSYRTPVLKGRHPR